MKASCEANAAGGADCLNIWFLGCDDAAPIVGEVIEGAFKIAPDLGYRPNLVSGVRIGLAASSTPDGSRSP